MQIFDREVAIKALVGSHNYNLDTPQSDKDYKYFVYPNINDLYDGIYFTHAVNSTEVDMTVHDIRRLPIFLCKANINFLEILFSKEIYITSSINHIFMPYREEFIRYNALTFYNACMGTALQKMGKIYKYTNDTKQLEEKFGYNVKEASHALRALLVLKRYVDFDFSFEKALSFEEGKKHASMLALKNGEWKVEEFMEQYTLLRARLEQTKFKNKLLNQKDLDENVDFTIRNMPELRRHIIEKVKRNGN